MLTAVAYGPVGPFAFCANSDCGIGLFARSELKPNQDVTEYAGPRLPIRLLHRSDYALQIPGSQVFIDGKLENSPFPDLPLSVGIFANHSRWPNARFERRAVADAERLPMQLRHRMFVVATEMIPAGGEIRVDYERGNSQSYWKGNAPPETKWRRQRVSPPPPSGEVPVIGATSAPVKVPAAGAAIPWTWPRHVSPAGRASGDERLRVLVPLLRAPSNPSNWVLVATHLPGRSARECRDRWGLIKGAAEAAHSQPAPQPSQPSPPLQPPPRPSKPSPSLKPADSAGRSACPTASGTACAGAAAAPRLRVRVPLRSDVPPGSTIYACAGGKWYELEVVERCLKRQQVMFVIPARPGTESVPGGAPPAADKDIAPDAVVYAKWDKQALGKLCPPATPGADVSLGTQVRGADGREWELMGVNTTHRTWALVDASSNKGVDADKVVADGPEPPVPATQAASQPKAAGGRNSQLGVRPASESGSATVQPKRPRTGGPSCRSCGDGANVRLLGGGTHGFYRYKCERCGSIWQQARTDAAAGADSGGKPPALVNAVANHENVLKRASFAAAASAALGVPATNAPATLAGSVAEGSGTKTAAATAATAAAAAAQANVALALPPQFTAVSQWVRGAPPSASNCASVPVHGCFLHAAAPQPGPLTQPRAAAALATALASGPVANAAQPFAAAAMASAVTTGGASTAAVWPSGLHANSPLACAMCGRPLRKVMVAGIIYHQCCGQGCGKWYAAVPVGPGCGAVVNACAAAGVGTVVCGSAGATVVNAARPELTSRESS